MEPAVLPGKTHFDNCPPQPSFGGEPELGDPQHRTARVRLKKSNIKSINHQKQKGKLLISCSTDGPGQQGLLNSLTHKGALMLFKTQAFSKNTFLKPEGLYYMRRNQLKGRSTYKGNQTWMGFKQVWQRDEMQTPFTILPLAAMFQPDEQAAAVNTFLDGSWTSTHLPSRNTTVSEDKVQECTRLTPWPFSSKERNSSKTPSCTALKV